MIEFDVKIEANDLYNYMMFHAYNNSASGILGSCVGAILLIVYSRNLQWIYLIFGLITLLYLPWNLFLKSRRQILNNPAFRNPLHYVLDEEGITVSQGEVEQKQAWDDLYKAMSSGKSIIVYTTPVNAAIFPNRMLGEQRTRVIEMISTHMPPKKVKIRS